MSKGSGAKFCDLMRKNVTLDSIENHINKIQQDAADQKLSADEREAILEQKREGKL